MQNFFSVDLNPIDTNHISDIHTYLMKIACIFLGIIKNVLLY